MKEHKGMSGIYSITNLINQKVYVGKTNDFYKRYYQYVSGFRKNSTNRINSYLLSSFNKYGFDNFKFKVVEFVEVDNLSERELHWIDQLDTTNRDKGYNLRRDSSTGMIVHKSTREKISNRLRKEWKEGVRAGHSDKLKESWKTRDKDHQASLFTKCLTKYKYIIHFPENTLTVLYKELRDLGFKNVLGCFFDNQCDDVIFKGIRIERVSYEDQTERGLRIRQRQ